MLFNNFRHKSVSQMSVFFLVVTELICIFALYLTKEIHTVVWFAYGVFFLLRFFSFFKLSGLISVISLLSLVFISYFLHRSLHYHPLIAVGHVLPFSMAVLALSSHTDGYRGWRMGVSFIIALLAAALSPDFIIALFVLIYCFFMLICISFVFLESEYKNHSLVHLKQPVYKGFYRNQLMRIFYLLLFSALVFPFLPRISDKMQWSPGSSSQAGYTERISLSRVGKIQSNDQIAMRMYGDESSLSDFYLGLLKSKILPVYIDGEWVSETQKPARQDSVKNFKKSVPKNKEHMVRVIRESLDTDRLPVPYGTLELKSDWGGYQVPIQANHSKEFVDPRSLQKRHQYNFYFSTDIDSLVSSFSKDRVQSYHLKLPDGFSDLKTFKLAQSLITQNASVRSKVDSMLRYFRDQRFQADLEGMTILSSQHNQKSILQIVDQFVFEDKRAHCEIFASTLTFMLRSVGVPARVVAGFRVSRQPQGDILTLRMGDAHAWVEYYLDDKGWIPVDPTPRVLLVPSIQDWFLDRYDWVSGKWYQYVLNYGQSGESNFWDQFPKWVEPIKKISKLGIVIFFIGLVSATLLFLIFKKFLRKRDSQSVYWNNERIKKLMFLRHQFDVQIVKVKDGSKNLTLTKEQKNWIQSYEALRFSKKLLEADFDQNFRELVVWFKNQSKERKFGGDEGSRTPSL